MKINFLPKKKAVWNTTYKTFHIIALIALVFNMSSIGVFLTPNTAHASAYVPPPIPAPDFDSVVWTAYEINGHIVTDWEDGVCSTNDDSNGGTRSGDIWICH